MQLPSVPRLVLSGKKQVSSPLNNKRFKKDPKFITSAAQAAPAPAGDPLLVSWFLPLMTKSNIEKD